MSARFLPRRCSGIRLILGTAACLALGAGAGTSTAQAAQTRAEESPEPLSEPTTAEDAGTGEAENPGEAEGTGEAEGIDQVEGTHQGGDTGDAAVPSSQAPGSVVASLNLGIGPNVVLDANTPFPTGRIALDGLYRLQRADAGPAVGLMAHMLFRGSYFGLQLGPIASWDLYLTEVEGIRIYVGPIVGTGYNLTAVDTEFGSVTGHAWFLHLGGQARAMFNETWGAFVRPVSFDVVANDAGAYGHWSWTLGVSYDL